MGDTQDCRALLLRRGELQTVELLEMGSPLKPLSEEPVGPAHMVPFALGSTKAAQYHELRGKTTLCLLLYMGKRQPLVRRATGVKGMLLRVEKMAPGEES